MEATHNWPRVYGFHLGGFHNPCCQGYGYGFSQYHYGNMDTSLDGDGFLQGIRQEYFVESADLLGHGYGDGMYGVSSRKGAGSVGWPKDPVFMRFFNNHLTAKKLGVPECIIDLEMVEDPTLARYGKVGPPDA